MGKMIIDKNWMFFPFYFYLHWNKPEEVKKTITNIQSILSHDI